MLQSECATSVKPLGSVNLKYLTYFVSTVVIKSDTEERKDVVSILRAVVAVDL